MKMWKLLLVVGVGPLSIFAAGLKPAVAQEHADAGCG